MPDIFVANKKRHPEELPKNPHYKHPTLLTSYCDAPSNLSFMGQEKEEKLLLFLRRHPITNFVWIAIAIALMLIPFVIFVIIQMANPSFSTGLPFRYILISVIFYYLFILSYIFANFLSWFYNIFLVTQKRIIDLDYSNLVYHHSTVTKVEMIQDVSHSRAGFIGSLFNYGNIFVQTAGSEPNLEAYSVPKPSRAANIIADLIGHQGRKNQ